MTRKELYKEIKATSILAFGIAIAVVFLAILNNKIILKYFRFSFGIYIVTVVIFHLVSLFLKNKYFDKFSKIISYPSGIIYPLLIVILPFLMLILHVILYFGIAFLIPELIFEVLFYFDLFEFITKYTLVYLKITLTVFISVLFNPILRDIVYYISARISSSEKSKPFELGKPTDYFLSPNNVKFFVYTFYFIALLITNYFNFQGDTIGNNIITDKSIIQSFVTFIAFDRTLALAKQLDFKPSGLLDKIYQSISNKIRSETTSDKN